MDKPLKYISVLEDDYFELLKDHKAALELIQTMVKTLTSGTVKLPAPKRRRRKKENPDAKTQ